MLFINFLLSTKNIILTLQIDSITLTSMFQVYIISVTKVNLIWQNSKNSKYHVFDQICGQTAEKRGHDVVYEFTEWKNNFRSFDILKIKMVIFFYF